MKNLGQFWILIRKPRRLLKGALNVRRMPVKTVKLISSLTRVQRDIVVRYSSEYDIKAKNWSMGEYAAQFLVNGKNYSSSEDYRTWYIVTRILKPEIVVETGVFHGFSSLSFLLAMEENNEGHLYSIDLPSPKLLSSGKEPGWVVPEHLRKRWDLRFGTSSELLPSLLEEVKMVDIFLHDSEHSYENMYWEYKTAWRYIRKGGLLLSHDITLNSAFRDFAKYVSEKWCYMLGNTAGIKRTK